MSKNKTIDVSALQQQRQKDKEIHKNLTKEEQDHLQNMFDESELQNYFINAQGKIPLQTIEIAGLLYAQEAEKKLAAQIKMGAIEVSQQPEVLDKDFLKQKISIEQQKTMSLKLKKLEIEQRLKYLEMQTSPYMSIKTGRVNPQLSEQFRPPNVLSKEEHESYMQKVIRQREERDKKQKLIVQKLEQGIKQQEERLKALQTQKLNKEKQKRRKQIEKNLEKKKEQHKIALQQEIKSRQQYKKVKNKQFLHQKLEDRFQSEVLIPALQEKKKKLKQIREMSKAFGIQDILKHEKQYTQKRNQSFSMVKSKVNDDWHYKPPQKKERLSQMLEEEKLEQRKKLEQKKRQIEEKIQKQTNYVQYLKERFVPKIDEEKKRQMQERKMIISKPKRRQPSLDAKTLGISYLEQAKRLKKQKITIPDRPQTEKNSDFSIEKTSEKGMTDYLAINRKQKQYYESKRRKRLQNLISSQNSSVQKIKKLKQESQKINQAYSRKYELAKLKHEDINQQQDALELLLSGIKAKMGIINVYNNSKQTI